MYIALYGDPDSWIAIKLDNDRRGYGYIPYKNNSDAFFERKIKILKLKNITIIPFLEGHNLQEFNSNKHKKMKEIDIMSNIFYLK